MLPYLCNTVTFRESKKEYFSKKVWFSILMFFCKRQVNIREIVSMTAITWSDEGLSETMLGLVDAVLGEFRKENPCIANMYINLENTGSYYRNFAAFKFSIKPVNPKVQSLYIMITMSPIHYQVLIYCFATG